jgi:hypothetical protein
MRVYPPLVCVLYLRLLSVVTAVVRMRSRWLTEGASSRFLGGGDGCVPWRFGVIKGQEGIVENFGGLEPRVGS